MSTEKKIMVRQLHGKVQSALINAIPSDTPDDVIEAVFAKLIVSLGNDLADWAMRQEV